MPESTTVPAPKAVPEVDELVAQSLRIGADPRLVQGAGGNLSVKHDGVMWIKASGTRLSQAAERRIFVPMGVEATRAAVLETEDLMPLVLTELAEPGLRPSIETSLHVLLPHRVVFHAHATGAIAAGLTAESARRIHDFPDAAVAVVPYAKPGIELARAVFAELGDEVDPDRPLVLLLRNHGVVVGASDSEAAGALLDAVEEFLRTGPAPALDPAAPAAGEASAPGASVPLHPAGTVGARAAQVLTSGAFTPDSAVFLGPKPFGLEGAAEGSPCIVAADGSVSVLGGLGADEIEIAISLVDVAGQVGGDEPTSILTDRDVHALLNWEAEKWRQNLKR